MPEAVDYIALEDLKPLNGIMRPGDNIKRPMKREPDGLKYPKKPWS